MCFAPSHSDCTSPIMHFWGQVTGNAPCPGSQDISPVKGKSHFPKLPTKIPGQTLTNKSVLIKRQEKKNGLKINMGFKQIRADIEARAPWLVIIVHMGLALMSFPKVQVTNHSSSRDHWVFQFCLVDLISEPMTSQCHPFSTA